MISRGHQPFFSHLPSPPIQIRREGAELSYIKRCFRTSFVSFSPFPFFPGRMSSARIRNGSAKMEQSNGQDVFAHGFHGYKEGYEQLEKIGLMKRVKGLWNKTVFPLFLMILTPHVALIMWYVSVHCEGSYSVFLGHFAGKPFYTSIIELWATMRPPSQFSVLVLFGFSVWSVILMKLLPGKIIKGPLTPKGNIPVYVDNGFLNYIVTMTTFSIITVLLKLQGLSPSVIYDRFDEFIATLQIFSPLFCVLLYLKGRYWPSTTDNGVSGNFIFDFYWGTELYPRIFGIDIKVFTNCRFGMTVWALLVCIHALKSFELYGFVDSMFVSAVLQLIYITKFFWWEGGYMSTIDIMVDRAGYYICWGCLVYVPTFYASVSMYLVQQPVHLGITWSSLILLTGILCIAVNYLADLQKQEVRGTGGKCLVWGKRPNIIRAKYQLENGKEKESILLASGWWGLARHFNYLAEIMLALCWTVPSLFVNIMPYSYVIFLTFLLIHRSYRDDDKCGDKYGSFWVEYCQMVPHRIVPLLF